jgi:SAM-dependent methyltransferase
METSDPAAAWVTSLVERHTSHWSRPEFLKAVRALSARYVRPRTAEGRGGLASAAQRAAFAGFFAPLHFFTARAIVRRLDLAARPIAAIVDLGCGTGVASAAWAGEFGRVPPSIVGVDRDRAMLAEARVTWTHFGLHGVARHEDAVAAAGALVSRRAAAQAIVLGWSVNELSSPARARLLLALRPLAALGHRLLILEPIARRATPWWDAWCAAFVDTPVRADDWKLDLDLPPVLADLDEAAGFRREALSARTLLVG